MLLITDKNKMDLSEIEWGPLYRINVTKGREKGRAIFGTVMYFRVPKMQGISLTAHDILASQAEFR